MSLTFGLDMIMLVFGFPPGWTVPLSMHIVDIELHVGKWLVDMLYALLPTKVRQKFKLVRVNPHPSQPNVMIEMVGQKCYQMVGIKLCYTIRKQ
ncbi:hypothetical protein Fmac_017203 [Flemingia macrophylla]|uniref:Uncharacterized protein n=1 Tax=Flemingia macrophylla TaxID=520843 RepID=A0ABD1M1F7_9FABA